jgi:hypothetical protein
MCRAPCSARNARPPKAECGTRLGTSRNDEAEPIAPAARARSSIAPAGCRLNTTGVVMVDTKSGSFRDEFYDRIDRDIKQYGRSIIGVGSGDDGALPFAYTIGNQLQALPELLIIGMMKAGFLNDLSQIMIDARGTFANGQLVRIDGARLPVKVIRANKTAYTEYTVQAGRYFGHDDYPIMQVLMPDRDGKFPDEAGCQPPYSDVPILGLD